MTVTMPNGGHIRQLRIKLSLELAKKPAATGEKETEGGKNDIMTPRIYDALVRMAPEEVRRQAA